MLLACATRHHQARQSRGEAHPDARRVRRPKLARLGRISVDLPWPSNGRAHGTPPIPTVLAPALRRGTPPSPDGASPEPRHLVREGDCPAAPAGGRLLLLPIAIPRRDQRHLRRSPPRAIAAPGPRPRSRTDPC